MASVPHTDITGASLTCWDSAISTTVLGGGVGGLLALYFTVAGLIGWIIRSFTLIG